MEAITLDLLKYAVIKNDLNPINIYSHLKKLFYTRTAL